MKQSVLLIVVLMASMVTIGCVDSEDESPVEAFEVNESSVKPLRCDVPPQSSYISRDTALCAGIRFVCEDGFAPFFNDCGCGCAPEEGSCVIGGCSGQLCVSSTDEPIHTTCEYLPAYACYADATCEEQNNGRCGWTMTRALRSCLRDARNTR